mmetsp:Transcript_17908/g.45796  ORF Transcript_17908/g.45796 Transcript_17908/m.45796 type:complete len:253 (+) Transcript_17908:569-1327(+)
MTAPSRCPALVRTHQHARAPASGEGSIGAARVLRSQYVELGIVWCHSGINLPRRIGQRLVVPHVPDARHRAIVELHIDEAAEDLTLLVTAVPKCDSDAASCEWSGPRLQSRWVGRSLLHQAARDAEAVLIDCNDISVAQDLERHGRRIAKVGADYQWCLEQAPNRKVAAVLHIGHATIPNLEHIWVVPASRSGIVKPLCREVGELHHGPPLVRDVSCRAPRIRDWRSPSCRILGTPFTHGKEHRAPRRVQCL